VQSGKGAEVAPAKEDPVILGSWATVHFCLKFKTNFGQGIRLLGSHPKLGKGACNRTAGVITDCFLALHAPDPVLFPSQATGTSGKQLRCAGHPGIAGWPQCYCQQEGFMNTNMS
jgi:hypothetical protein